MTLSPTPIISVVIPVYNVKRYLPKCLDSVLASTFAEIEIIAVDDGSTDGSGAMLDEYVSGDSRMQVVHVANGGYGKAVNIGMDKARGEYVSIIESDDWINPRMFEVLYGHAKDCRPDVIKGRHYRCRAENKSEPDVLPDSLPFVRPFSLSDQPDLALLGPTIWSALYKREFLKKNGIRMRETPGASYQDMPFAFTVYAKADSILLCSDFVYYYRSEAGQNSSTRRSDRKLFMILEQIRWTIDILKTEQVWEAVKEQYGRNVFGIMTLFLRNAGKDIREELWREFCVLFQNEPLGLDCFGEMDRLRVSHMLRGDYKAYRQVDVLEYKRKKPFFFLRPNYYRKLLDCRD